MADLDCVKTAIKQYQSNLEQIKLKRSALWHDEMAAWAELQEVLSTPASPLYDECYNGD